MMSTTTLSAFATPITFWTPSKRMEEITSSLFKSEPKKTPNFNVSTILTTSPITISPKLTKCYSKSGEHSSHILIYSCNLFMKTKNKQNFASLNSSPAKQQYSFSKSKRFSPYVPKYPFPYPEPIYPTSPIPKLTANPRLWATVKGVSYTIKQKSTIHTPILFPRSSKAKKDIHLRQVDMYLWNHF